MLLLGRGGGRGRGGGGGYQQGGYGGGGGYDQGGYGQVLPSTRPLQKMGLQTGLSWSMHAMITRASLEQQ